MVPEVLGLSAFHMINVPIFNQSLTYHEAVPHRTFSVIRPSLELASVVSGPAARRLDGKIVAFTLLYPPMDEREFMKRKFQIFVSSTFKDLIPERQAAVSAILKAGHIPAGMELFTAGDKSQMDTIKKWIDESDVYMLILGGRYGSIEPISGVSYTELEYNYAVEQKKPLFAVVITDYSLEAKVQKLGIEFFETENQSALKQFRKKVLSNMSSFFEDDKDIRLAVHESLSDFAASRDLKGWVQADEVIDTKPIFEEIKKLSEENQKLKDALAAQESKALSTRPHIEDFSEVTKILKSVEIKIPAKVSNKGKEAESNLYSVFVLNKDILINGVTDAASGSDIEGFFFFNICPKLQIHGFAEIERIAGVQWRRYNITKKGSEFLADYERRRFKVKQEESRVKKAEAVVENSVSNSEFVKAVGMKSINDGSQNIDSLPGS